MSVLQFCATGDCARLPPRAKRRVFTDGKCHKHYTLAYQERRRARSILRGEFCECGDPVVKAGKCLPCYDEARKERRNFLARQDRWRSSGGKVRKT